MSNRFGRVGGPTTTPLGEFLRRRREELGLHQLHVALRAELSQAAVSNFERGSMRPSVSSALKLARALEVAPALMLRHVLPELRDVLGAEEDAPALVA